ncbi:cytochrome c oxidase subunit 6A1, mitochondrial [Halictus rubicundus]|uniref:cytochrome c oxidase subunit 6A1, mitochondrial n=1 Tax=Halictus rubicundus TaxID=77578 RepID=UPI004036615F
MSVDTSQEKLWKYLVLFVAFPVLAVASALILSNVNRKNKQPRQEFVDVPYLRRINKPFPWGDGKHSLFHNPVKNPISPHGYEVPDPYAAETSEGKG